MSAQDGQGAIPAGCSPRTSTCRVAAMPDRRPEVVDPDATPSAELAEARAEAWAGGHAAGTADAERRSPRRHARCWTPIAASLKARQACAATRGRRATRPKPIARLLLDSLAKLLPALCAASWRSRADRAIIRILPALAQEPAITRADEPARTAPALAREIDRLDPDLAERVQAGADRGDRGRRRARAGATAGHARRRRTLGTGRAVLTPAGLLSRSVTVDIADADAQWRLIKYARCRPPSGEHAD